uniref:Uncharacterized protein n=1 Tax=Anguilla anguilla TaxID=7936 RepID=A0A0E9QL73_ANGAN
MFCSGLWYFALNTGERHRLMFTNLFLKMSKKKEQKHHVS